MIDPGHSQRSGDRQMVTEFSVAGRLGPMLRAAFIDQHITTRSECTVIRTCPATDRDLTDLVRALVERGLVVESVHRLPDVLPQHAWRAPRPQADGAVAATASMTSSASASAES